MVRDQGAGPRPVLCLRSRVETRKGSGVWREVSVQRPITPARSAVLVCDMWDAHWCRTAAERSALLAERIDELLREARSAGARIVHSPSDTLERYESTPQRQRMRDLPPVEPPEPLEAATPATARRGLEHEAMPDEDVISTTPTEAATPATASLPAPGRGLVRGGASTRPSRSRTRT